MGSAKRLSPNNLGNKLRQIREGFEYSTTQIANVLSDDKITVLRSDVSRFENGIREPSALILLRYARLMKISVESLIDDELDIKTNHNRKNA